MMYYKIQVMCNSALINIKFMNNWIHCTYKFSSTYLTSSRSILLQPNNRKINKGYINSLSWVINSTIVSLSQNNPAIMCSISSQNSSLCLWTAKHKPRVNKRGRHRVWWQPQHSAISATSSAITGRADRAWNKESNVYQATKNIPLLK